MLMVFCKSSSEFLFPKYTVFLLKSQYLNSLGILSDFCLGGQQLFLMRLFAFVMLDFVLEN